MRHVWESSTQQLNWPTRINGLNLTEDATQAALQQAKGQIEILQTGAGTAAHTFINSGDPAKVVAEAAKDYGAGLLVMGRHSNAGIAGYLRQNAYAILRESPFPVISI